MSTSLPPPLHYWLQPILCVEDDGQKILAHEFLCRWGDALSWFDRDKALLRALFVCQDLPRENLHINLGPAAVIALPPNLIEPVCERLGKQLVLEWTEQVVSKTDASVVAKRLGYWRKRYGVQISVDDFGAGQDGIGRVLLVEPDSVKIDGELFRLSLDSDSNASNILRRVCEWLIDRKTPIIIEHIETDGELLFAKALGANMGQGFLWNHLATNFHYDVNNMTLKERIESNTQFDYIIAVAKSC